MAFWDSESDSDESGSFEGPEVENFCPMSLYFTHDSVNWNFTSGRSLVDTFADLIYGSLSVMDIPPIHVVERWGKHWAVTGNRRLLLYKKLHRIGALNECVPVVCQCLDEDIFDRVFTTDVQGLWVWIRRHGMDASHQFNTEICDIVNQWRAN